IKNLLYINKNQGLSPLVFYECLTYFFPFSSAIRITSSSFFCLRSVFKSVSSPFTYSYKASSMNPGLSYFDTFSGGVATGNDVNASKFFPVQISPSLLSASSCASPLSCKCWNGTHNGPRINVFANICSSLNQNLNTSIISSLYSLVSLIPIAHP